MSYLNVPRLNFAGKFQADPSTVNNDVNHYDISTFNQSYQEFSSTIIQDGQPVSIPNGWWNPDGTGAWRLVDCVVTSVTYEDGTTTSDKSVEPIIGMSVMDSNARVSGKIVDLDPQQQSVSMIWGMVVRLTDGADLMKGNFEAVAFNNLWWAKNDARSAAAASACYQSVITDIVWSEAIEQSRYLRELHSVSAEKISIKFNVDLFCADKTQPNFTLGRLVGTMGPYIANEPKHFVMGRQLFPVQNFTQQGYLPAGNVYFATAIIDKSISSLVLDFGNSLATTGPNGQIAETRILEMAISDGQGSYESLGAINYTQPGWYDVHAGITTIPLSDALLEKAANNQLFVISNVPTAADSHITNVLTPLLTENTDYVRADNFVLRVNPGETAEINVFASQLGQPLAKAQIACQQLSDLIVLMGQGNGTPANGTPESAIKIDEKIPVTDEHGKTVVTLNIHNPGNPRKFIDGQVYALWCSIAGTQVPDFNPNNPQSPLIGYDPWDFVSVLVFDEESEEKINNATWRDIHPVMQQYANLYPIMSKGLFNIGRKEDVDNNAVLLKLAFALPIEDANHMPATRDLSRDKKQMILNYLDKVINKH